ncbi:transmembrane ascorbate ferrireductase 1-like [Impatiens glandulifera]|uniref:transmembrane ascorbate ferrireductase 1-like n=1 Tax=Impatiens glandulifera TaxID=253017 RepID=UPI001FB0584E|nr:transmembrane ascorbate ferrireductase 1-like [Impatiens glandulifera]
MVRHKIANREERERIKEMGGALKALHVSMIAHVLAVAGTVMVLVWCIHFRGGLAWESTNKALIFNIHPVLMLIGLIILGGEAIMSYRALALKKETKKLIHLLLHGIALMLGIIGIYAAFKYHNESNIANLYSSHSWFGLVVIILYGLQWIYGFVVFFYPGAATGIKAESLPWHMLVGSFVFLLAVSTAALGFLEKLTFLENSGLAKFGPEAFLINFTAIVTILFGIFVILVAAVSQPIHEVEEDYSYSVI